VHGGVLKDGARRIIVALRHLCLAR
jgi:hypothetical protein